MCITTCLIKVPNLFQTRKQDHVPVAIRNFLGLQFFCLIIELFPLRVNRKLFLSNMNEPPQASRTSQSQHRSCSPHTKILNIIIKFCYHRTILYCISNFVFVHVRQKVFSFMQITIHGSNPEWEGLYFGKSCFDP
jgi:hypothetical protein